MKILISTGFFIFALSFCNLAERFSGSKETGSSSDNTTASNRTNAPPALKPSDDDDVEFVSLSSELAALLTGDALNWEEQGLSWKLPKGWKKLSQDRNSLNYGSPDNAFLIVSISPMAEDFPVDDSIKANYDGAVTRMKNGEVKSVRYTVIDGVKGVEFVESAPDDKSAPQRHQWLAFRKYAGQVQMLNLMLSTKGSNFDKNAKVFQAIMYSNEIVK